MSKINTSAKPAAMKLSDVQRSLLAAAAQREDGCLTRPASLRGAQIAKLGQSLIAAGYAREVKSKNSMPRWRQDGKTGATLSLKLTAAGARAVALEGAGVESKGNPARADKRHASQEIGTAAPANATPSTACAIVAAAPRPTSKIAAVIGLLSRAEGATLAELIAATQWLPHTTRAALTGLR